MRRKEALLVLVLATFGIASAAPPTPLADALDVWQDAPKANDAAAWDGVTREVGILVRKRTWAATKTPSKALIAILKAAVPKKPNKPTLEVFDNGAGAIYVEGKTPGLVATLFASDKEGQGRKMALCTVWIPLKAKTGDQVLDCESYPEPVMTPESAVIASGKLILVGIFYTGGNSPGAGALVFKNESSGWVQEQHVTTEEECWDPPTLPKVKGKTVASPLVIYTRTDPTNLQTAHAGPRVLWSNKWVWENGAYKFIKTSRVATPIATLDLMVGWAQLGSYKTLKIKIADPEMLKDFAAWARKSRPLLPLVVSNGKGDRASKLESEGYTFEFSKTAHGWILRRFRRAE